MKDQHKHSIYEFKKIEIDMKEHRRNNNYKKFVTSFLKTFKMKITETNLKRVI